MVDTTNAADRLAGVGIDAKTIPNVIKNKALTERFMQVLDFAEVTTCPKEKGALFSAVASKVKPKHVPYLDTLAKFVGADKWNKVAQIDEAIKFLDAGLAASGNEFVIDQAKLAEETGVGIVVTQEQIQKLVDELFEEHKDAIMEKKHDF